MAVRQRGAGSTAGAGGTGDFYRNLYVSFEEALRKAYEAARINQRDCQLSAKLGNLNVEVCAEHHAVIFRVFERGHFTPLCRVELYFSSGEPVRVVVDCEKLEELASGCARGGGCALSWEEMERALELAGWAANVLAGLAGIPLEVEEVELLEARDTGSGGPRVLPCLQVSAGGGSYSVCKFVDFRHDPGKGWLLDRSYRLFPIDENLVKLLWWLAGLKRMVNEFITEQERGGVRFRFKETLVLNGNIMGLSTVVLRFPNGRKDVFLVPQPGYLHYLGEGFAAVLCLDADVCMKSGDYELADTLRRDAEEVVREVVLASRHYRETEDPRFTTFAYIVVEALSRAGLA